jgi:hypothetical protein
MNAKEKQTAFIKAYLKPTLKQFGYSTNSQTWWKTRDDFHIVINLQNFSWNSKDEVNFSFNIGIALKATTKDNSKPSYHDLNILMGQNGYLPIDRFVHDYHNKTGYIIKTGSDLANLINEFKIDFEQNILPALDGLNTLEDCINYYQTIPFWGERLRQQITDLGLR